jgi:NAD(P)-dependent dehydrogenase (short-subunit alcohol dehydrogenase family)
MVSFNLIRPLLISHATPNQSIPLGVVKIIEVEISAPERTYMSSLRCLVTGAASGIGREVVSRLRAQGRAVLATDVDEAALERSVIDHRPGERIAKTRLDVRDPAAWQAALDAMEERWGGVDVVFNVAGYLHPGYVAELALTDVDRTFDINVKGVIFGTRLASAKMVAAGSGHIVNVASMAAFTPVPGLSLYGASKYAVRSFSLAAAMELRAHGVAVTVVCPDAVATPMLDKQQAFDEAALTFSAPRVLSAEEVADALTGVVIDERPFELALPRSRKWMARAIDLFPDLGPRLAPIFQHIGRRAQRRRARR